MNEQAEADLSSTATAPVAPTAETDHLLEQAWLAHWERDYAKAEMLYQQAIALNTQLIASRVLFAVFLAQQGRADEAEAQLKQSLAIDAELTTTRLNLARNRDPHNKAILHLSAWLNAYGTKQTDQAAAEVSPAAGPEIILPDQPIRAAGLVAPDNQAADITAQEIQPVPAQTSDSVEPKALPTQNEAAQVRFALIEADQLCLVEDYEQATALLQPLQGLLPDDEEIRGRLDNIKQQQRQLITVNSWLVEAKQKALTGDITAALAWFQRAEVLKPNSPTIALARQQLQPIEEALKLLTEAGHLIENWPETALERIKQARSLAPNIEIGTLEARAQAVRQKQQVDTLLQQGHLAEQNGNLKEAFEAYQAAVKLQPQLAAAQTALKNLTAKRARVEHLQREAEKFYQAGHCLRAEQVLQQALVLAPKDKKLHTILKKVTKERLRLEQVARVAKYRRQAEEREAQGDFEQAQTLWAETLRLQPDDETLQQAQAAFLERQAQRQKIKIDVSHPHNEEIPEPQEQPQETEADVSPLYLDEGIAEAQKQPEETQANLSPSHLHQEQIPEPQEQPQEIEPSVNCPHCGQPGRAEAKFCRNCGRSRAAPACSHCGTALRIEAKFCANCGHSVLPQPEVSWCKTCGAALRPQARFCSSCGKVTV